MSTGVTIEDTPTRVTPEHIPPASNAYVCHEPNL